MLNDFDPQKGAVCLWCRFLFFYFYASSGVSLKGMIENSLLLKDEPISPNIDKVMRFKFLEGWLKIQKLANIGLLDSGFYFFVENEKE